MGHTATLLPNGKVLVTGGWHGVGLYLASAELYDPDTNTWSSAGSMTTGRYYHTATLLSDGAVLVTGGYGDSGSLSSVEIYFFIGQNWVDQGNIMTTARYGHTATLLPNDKVLVAGGATSSAGLATAELYDCGNHRCSATGSLPTGRIYQTATLLGDGQVLVAGGFGNNTYLASAWLYNPATGTWSVTGSLAIGRRSHTATLLPNGQVLVEGGKIGSAYNDYTSKVEIYHSTGGVWSPGRSMGTGRASHTATLLPKTGKVLVAGAGQMIVVTRSVPHCPVPNSTTCQRESGRGAKNWPPPATGTQPHCCPKRQGPGSGGLEQPIPWPAPSSAT